MDGINDENVRSRFNENGELTAPIRIDDDDVAEFIDPETGCRFLEHEPSGNVWAWRPDGTLVSPSVQTSGISNVSLNPDRPLWSTEDRRIVVDKSGNGDAESLTQAVQSIPMFVFHDLVIEISPGDYSNEGTHIVPPTIGSQMNPDGTESNTLRIIGDTSDPATTKTGPFVIDSFQGIVSVKGVEIQHPTTEVNENAAFTAFDTKKARFGSSKVVGGRYNRTIQAYGNTILEPQGLDFDGEHSVLISCKQGGCVKHVQSAPDSDIRLGGSLSDQVLRVDIGGRYIDFEHELSAVTDLRFGSDIYPRGGPIHYDNAVYHRSGKVDGAAYAELPAGTNHRVETGIAASTTSRSRILTVSHKRSGSARVDTAVLLVNDSGAAGTDESTTLHRTDHSSGLDAVEARVHQTTHEIVLDVDTLADGLLTVMTM
ncbi:hypothetical protein VB773_02375 [Haloarculaceae archaeon H-GB2-1]|nr:hypothetical protein [Haloarculaceae archaeon H-GB1-1]MEA5388508.1 hypothetical protein [Haloarculaceae archaeon H-GB11]MEA5406538.1 hypothetical protein [Haloarculaceae archaeon H-GB2-1]